MRDRWLYAQSLCLNWRPQDEADAEAILSSIIAQHPSFVPAYSSLAGILNSRHLVFPGTARSGDRHRSALELAKTAVELDALDSRNHLCLAWSTAMSGSFDRAVTSFELACELNDNDPWTLVSSALGLAYCGRDDSARRVGDLALERGLGASRLHWAYQATIRFLLGEYTEAVTAGANAREALFHVGAWKAAAHAMLGDRAAARAEGRRFLEIVEGNWFGDAPFTPRAALTWVLGSFPLAQERAWTVFREGLMKAGLPVPDDANFTERPARTATGQRQPRIV